MASNRRSALLVAVAIACLTAVSLFAPRAVAPWEETAAAEGPPRRLAEAVVRSEGYAATLDMARDMADEVFGNADGPSGELPIPRPVRDDAAAQAVRHLFEQMNVSGKDTIGFSECQGRLVKHCKTIIRRYLRDNSLLRGPQRIDIQLFRKRSGVRNPNEEGSNKVVIVTNALGDAVTDIPKYPDGWTWNGRTIGPWPSCVGQPPEDCCLSIRNDVPDPEGGRAIECQFFNVELAGTGVRYPRPRDAQGNPINGIIMYRSVDAEGRGRVQETPFIQADFTLPTGGGGRRGGSGNVARAESAGNGTVVDDDDYADDDYEGDDDDHGI